MRSSVFLGRRPASQGLIQDMTPLSTAYVADDRPTEFFVGPTRNKKGTRHSPGSVESRVGGIWLVAYDEQVAGVLRVDLAVPTQRGWSVGRAEGQLLEEFLPQRSPLVDGVEVAVFTVCVHDAIGVNHRRVDAPLERVGVVGDAGDGSVRIPGAALRVGVLEAPLDRQVRAELGDEELLRARWIGRRAVRGTDRR